MNRPSASLGDRPRLRSGTGRSLGLLTSASLGRRLRLPSEAEAGLLIDLNRWPSEAEAG